MERRLRAEAIAWLKAVSDDGARPLTRDQIADFRFEGAPFRLLDRQRGITKSARFAAAISITTVYRAPGQARPYDDRLHDDGYLRYQWRGVDPDLADNRSLRQAMLDQTDLMWFYGVGPGLFHPVMPVRLVHEHPAEHEFSVQIGDLALPEASTAASPLEVDLRRYVLRETRQRLHQPVFRATVIRAYGTRCAVCSLRHAALLDAAHIVPDRDDAGIASVTNGLALCKIHHAAYDQKLLGIRPDHVVRIRPALLEETDGPMLLHGLQELHDQRLRVLPQTRSERPAPELLDRTFQEFLAAC